MAATLENFIAGERRAPSDGRTADLIDPSTEEVFAQAPLSSAADVDAACQAAAQAFETWRDTTPAERQLALMRIADAFEARADELLDAEVQNTGKPRELTASEEIPPMVDQIRFFAGAARCLEGRAAGEYMAGHTSYIRREPIGVCAQVTPWNYPMMMAVWKFAPALAAGNTIVLKPSDTTPASTLLMAEIAAEFLPPGVFNVVCGDRDTGRALVEHPIPQMVSVTGSIRAGKEVMAAAAADLKNVHLELGGKAPVVVFDDADIEAAAEAIGTAGWFNAGQDCTAASRVLAGPGVHDDFVAALTEQAKGTVTGPPTNEDALYGPLNNANQIDRVAGFVDRLPGHAEVTNGGSRVDGKGYFYAPDRRRRPAPGRRDGAAGGLRSGDQRAALHRRGRGGRAGPTGWSTGSRRASSPGTTAGRCGWPGASTSGACGSTPTSRSSPRCPTAASSTRAPARTSRCTASRTTRASST